jgi:methylmalonyl-CoA mutase C-terminal domain/subunit
MARRVLLAKVGLDGHDRGAKVVARLLRDTGYEVIYTGMRQQPSVVVSTAEQEDADVIGLSILSGAHVVLTRSVMRELRARGLDAEIDVVVGGTVPPRDVPILRDAGAAAVFGVGSTMAEIQAWFKERLG